MIRGCCQRCRSVVWTWLGSGGEGKVVDVSRGRRVAASGAVDGRGRVVVAGWWTGVAVVGCGRRSLAGSWSLVVIRNRGQESQSEVVVWSRSRRSWSGVVVVGRGLES